MSSLRSVGAAFSWHAQDISRELTNGIGQSTPLSILASHPPPGRNSAMGRPSTSFQSCGDFICYTTGWQEKQALGFIRFQISSVHLIFPFTRTFKSL